MRLLLTLAAAAALMQPLLAQPARKSDVSTKETRAMMHNYAKCVVERRHARASEAILSNLDNGTILRKYPMLVIGECLRGPAFATTKMSFSGDLYRYALADALVNKELAGAPPPDVAQAPALVHREAAPAPQEVNAKGKKLSQKDLDKALQDHRESIAFRWLALYGECIVRSDAAGAKALLLTVPDSPEEAARFVALRPAMELCVPEGQTLKFGKVVLRGSIAVNYYRIARAAPTPAEKAPA